MGLEASIKNKRLAKNTIFLNIRLIVVLLINLYASRVILKTLGVEDYGLYTLVGGFVTLLSVFTSSITGSVMRFVTFDLGKNDKVKLHKTFTTILNTLIITGIVILVLGVISAPFITHQLLTIPQHAINAAYVILICSIGVFVLNLLSTPYIALINAHEHLGFYAIMSVFDAAIKLLTIFMIGFLSKDRVVVYAYVLLGIALIERIVYWVYCNIHFRESKYEFCLDRATLKEFFSFSIWIGLGSAAGILKDQSSNILLNVFFSLPVNAAMGITNQIKGLIAQFDSSIGTAISPQITKEFAINNIHRAFKLSFLMTKCQGVFIMLIAIPLVIYTEQILEIWLGDVPEYTTIFVRLIIIASFFNSVAQGYGPLFLASGKVKKYQIFASVVMASYVPISYMLLYITRLPYICVVVTCCMELFFILTNFFYLHQIIDFPFKKFLKEVVLRIFLIFILGLFICFELQKILPQNLFSLILNSIIAAIVVLTLTYYFLLGKKEREGVGQFIKDKI